MKYGKLRNISILFRARQEENKDVLCISTGEKGDGKSNLTMNIAIDYIKRWGLTCKDCKKEWIYTGDVIEKDSEKNIVNVKENLLQPCPYCGSNNVKNTKHFDFLKYMGYTNDEMQEKIDDLPQFAPLLGDEAAEWLLSEDWNKSENKRLKKRFIKIRTKKLIVFGNIPEFVTIDSKYRNLANYWIRIMQRNDDKAIAVFFRKNKAEVADKWHIGELQKLMPQYYEDTPIEDIEELCDKIIRKHPCAFDYFIIPPIDADIYAEYEKFRDMKVWEKSDENIEISQKLLSRVIVYNLVTRWDEFVEAVSKKKNKKPTLELLEKYIVYNPQTGEPFVNFTNIGVWIRKVADILKKKKI